jgi:YbgC/YbaW family acyl-CoA thioester hydrolase
MPTLFRTTRRVEFADTDMAGIMHFANFFRFMEAAETEFLRTLGLSVSMNWEGQGIGFPRVSASCDYLKPAHFEDVLEVTVRLARLGRKSVTYAFEFFKDGDVIARGQISSVFCRIGTGHKVESLEMPTFLRERLEQGSVADSDLSPTTSPENE